MAALPGGEIRSMRVHERLFIGGDWVEAAGTAAIEVISPHTKEVIARVPDGCEADFDRAVGAAREAFDDGEWPRMPAAQRADFMAKLLSLLQERSAELATTITSEMGSPISFSHLGQVMASSMVLDYYVGLARDWR